MTINGVDGVGVESRVNQQIDLSSRIALGNDQEWRIESESGSVRQLTNGNTRNLNLNTSVLTLNAVNAGNAFVLEQAIIGSGGLIISGAGSTTLSGANTYTGGTYINGGTLRVSSDANLGNAAGTLEFNGGVLQISGTTFTATARAITLDERGGTLDVADAGNTVTVGTGVAGTGSLTKLGAGALSLSGDNRYSGDTRIESGRLSLTGAGRLAVSNRVVVGDGIFDISATAAGATIGTLAGAGDVALGTQTLTLTAANDTFGGTLQGSGGLTLNAGTQGLSGTSIGFTGPTTIQGGVLAVNGSIGNSAVTVRQGGTLAGGGTVGTTQVERGGVVAPGSSIGTLTVNGNFTQAAGSVYRIELDPSSSASDLIAVNGTATLQPGARYDLKPVSAASYRLGTKYTVLSATGGVGGTYGQSLPVSAFLALQDSNDSNHVYLNVVQTRSVGEAAETPNQDSTAGGLAGAAGDTVLNADSDAQARDMLDALSGEALASSKGMLVSGTLLVRNSVNDRLRDTSCLNDGREGRGSALARACASDATPRAWAQALGGWGRAGGGQGISQIKQDTAGFLIGADMPLAGDWRAGAFAGYTHTSFNVDQLDSKGGADSYHLGVYGGRQWDRLALRVGAAYSWHDVDTRRSVRIGNLSNNLRADYDAGASQVFGEVGYGLSRGVLRIEPIAALAFVNLRTDGFDERGGDAALSSRSDSSNTWFSTLGIRPSLDIEVGKMSGTVRGLIGWRHAFGDTTPTSTVAFSGGSAFSVSGAPIAEDAAVVEIGADLALSPTATLGLAYGGQFGSSNTDQRLQANLSVQF
ncbi:autotransporter domain-containing protein [Achromobacter sp. UMC46]|uniref:autotransporter outer membrane beta-barrel domain-containing protein n=1 Tax=Achromobacter sp. UMC46 TaxID=1862319 RepID=UPI001600D8A2|nr:autotransporter domain-containing protein [Achromobacter sp. UMC46]